MNIQRVGVLGSGIMGSGLAEVAARAGYEVVVRSRTEAGADAVYTGLDAGLVKQVARDKLTEDERQAILARITVTDDLSELALADLVIESVVEDLAVKKAAVRPARRDRPARGDPRHQHLDAAGRRPGDGHEATRAGLWHPLLQPGTDDEARRDHPAHHRGRRDDRRGHRIRRRRAARTRSRSKDRAGFIVNALLFPYLNNAVRMWEQGTASMDDIDTAMQGGCNFPMGPFALLDLVGLDTSLSILDALYAEFRDPNYAAVPTIRRMVAAGQLGRKTKQGFYTY